MMRLPDKLNFILLVCGKVVLKYDLYTTCICSLDFLHAYICTLYILPTVPDTPPDCIITAIYNQSSGKLVSIKSTWDTVTVSHPCIASCTDDYQYFNLPV